MQKHVTYTKTQNKLKQFMARNQFLAETNSRYLTRMHAAKNPIHNCEHYLNIFSINQSAIFFASSTLLQRSTNTVVIYWKIFRVGLEKLRKETKTDIEIINHLHSLFIAQIQER